MTMVDLDKLPFTLEWAVPSGDLTGRLLVTLAGKARDADLGGSVGCLEMFAAAAGHQLFTDSEATTRMEETQRVQTPDQSWQVEFEVASLPARALTVLAALLAQTCHSGDPLDTVRFQLLNRGTLGQFPRMAPEDVVRPVASIPFQLTTPEYYDPEQALDVTIEFAAPVTAERVDQIDEGLATWGYMVAMGGFLFSFEEQEDFIPEFGATEHLGPSVVRYIKEPFDGPPFAIHALVNYAAGLHRLGSPVHSLSIEQ
jgi:hypothetical protein